MKLVAVTSCPTGIAHTYMAAESIEPAATAAGHSITVETQGAAGADPIPGDVIAAADAVIFAADGPAHLIFLIAAPEGGGSQHMTILAALARRLVHASFREALATAPDEQTVVDIVTKEVLGS